MNDLRKRVHINEGLARIIAMHVWQHVITYQLSSSVRVELQGRLVLVTLTEPWWCWLFLGLWHWWVRRRVLWVANHSQRELRMRMPVKVRFR